jgi:hypothetical protein
LPPLVEYLRGDRDPSEALRLVNVLPEESVTAAMIRADPGSRKRRPKGEPWREQYGWTRTHEILAATFDLHAAVNKGKRKPLKFPRPGG